MWCWWCCHPFEGTPLNMPVDIYKNHNSKEWVTFVHGAV